MPLDRKFWLAFAAIMVILVIATTLRVNAASDQRWKYAALLIPPLLVLIWQLWRSRG